MDKHRLLDARQSNADHVSMSSFGTRRILLGAFVAFALSCASSARPVDREVRNVWLPGTPAGEIYSAALQVMRSRGSALDLVDEKTRLIEGGYGDFKVRILIPPSGSSLHLTCIHPSPWLEGTVPSTVCLEDLESAIRAEL